VEYAGRTRIIKIFHAGQKWPEMEEALQAEISVDLFHLQEKHQQVVEMLKH
jgi:hypothetical protein